MSTEHEDQDEDDRVCWTRIEGLTGQELRLVKLALNDAIERLRKGEVEAALTTVKNVRLVLRNYK
jgi:hypothetical protein